MATLIAVVSVSSGAEHSHTFAFLAMQEKTLNFTKPLKLNPFHPF